jgi:hypothetical protein
MKILFPEHPAVRFIFCNSISVLGSALFNVRRKYYLDDKIKKIEMSGACYTYRADVRCIQGYGWRNLSERDHLGDLGIDTY